jgi:hypothetical protein
MKTVKMLSFAMVVVGCLATGRSLFAHHGDAAYSGWRARLSTRQTGSARRPRKRTPRPKR